MYHAFSQAEAKGLGKENVVILRYSIIVPSFVFIVGLSAASWGASITNGGGSGAESKSIHVENMTLMEVKMFVEYMAAKISERPSFHWVGGCTPFVSGRRENGEC